MKKMLLLLSAFGFATSSQAQGWPGRVFDGISRDSAVISFADTLPSTNTGGIIVSLDTAHTTLWRNGTTSKAFFNAGIQGKPGIMTDTAQPYPDSANDAIILRVDRSPVWMLNPIASFTHKYLTDSGRDGGIVEYSFDSLQWSNVVGGCFANVPTDSFYRAIDTLPGGIPAFSGNSDWKRSRFQFFQGLPIKATGCSFKLPFWVRFRFVSDGTADSLAGWIIRNITIENDHYDGGVAPESRYGSLAIHPNPSYDGHFRWPQLIGQNRFILQLTNAFGQQVLSAPYSNETDFSCLLAGAYYYRVSDGMEQYGGILMKE